MGKLNVTKAGFVLAAVCFSGLAFGQATVSLGPESGTTSNEVIIGATTARVAVSFVGDGSVPGYGGGWE